ncbi:hypothetical protein BD410DRAFT_846383 [Rickenella mellea]|uniref:Uncharacterized protein n=1 Tax=Rickenella mellea TaxID=50990 RepID=A0A4Y7PFG8_9AGAM|nr:hypothetical protein BD410DRAFT_846383 [Rickenella mellea]
MYAFLSLQPLTPGMRPPKPFVRGAWIQPGNHGKHASGTLGGPHQIDPSFNPTPTASPSSTFGFTRTGQPYSPFARVISPVILPEDIDIEPLVKRAADEELRREEEGDFADELPLEDPGAIQADASSDDRDAELVHKRGPGTHQKSRSKKRRRAQREEQDDPGLPFVKSVSLKRRREAEPIHATIVSEELRVASTGWMGARARATAMDRNVHTLEDLLKPGSGFALVKWDGRHVPVQPYIYLTLTC